MKKQIQIFLFILAINFSFSTLATADESHAVEDGFSKLLSKRYSGYSYDASRPVSHEQLKAILEAGRLAPSSSNDQPWYFIVCDRNTNLKAYEDVMGTLVEFNQKWAKQAPVLIVSIADSKTNKNVNNRWGQYDTGAATYSMMLQATSLGLMAHQMGGIDETRIQKMFSLPDQLTVMSVMAIGYPKPDAVQPVRKRKPLSENFFADSWGKKFE